VTLHSHNWQKVKTGRAEKCKNSKQAEAESTAEETESSQKQTPSSSSNLDVTVSDGDDEEWENVSLELIRWNILVKQIEDLSLLTMVISQRPKLETPVLPVLSLEIQNLSVSDLLDKGKGVLSLYTLSIERNTFLLIVLTCSKLTFENLGCIAELVGKWLTSIGIDPALLVDETEVIRKEYVPSPETGDKKVKKGRKGSSQEKSPPPNDQPEEQAVEALHADKEISCVLGKPTMLQNGLQF